MNIIQQIRHHVCRTGAAPDEEQTSDGRILARTWEAIDGRQLCCLWDEGGSRHVGDAEEVLATLRTLPNDSGWDRVWEAFPAQEATIPPDMRPEDWGVLAAHMGPHNADELTFLLIQRELSTLGSALWNALVSHERVQLVEHLSLEALMEIDWPLCECQSCDCSEPATGTDDGGNCSCAACAQYMTTDDGEVVCGNMRA